jgi:predicted transcriptional regulator
MAKKFKSLVTKMSKESQKEIKRRVKQIDIQNVLDTLPDDTSVEELMEKLYLLSKVEKGLQQVRDGETLSHNDVKKKLTKWLD